MIVRFPDSLPTIKQGWPTFCTSFANFFKPEQPTNASYHRLSCNDDFTSLVIFQVMMLNAIGISCKSANKLHIYLLYNEFRSELASISPVISRNGGKLFTDCTEQQIIFQILIGKARLRFAFNQFHGQKCFFACERYFKTKYNSSKFS